MIDPLFWLGLSILLVAVSIAAVLIVMVPAIQELSRAARSAEKLFDTLNRELPPTLEAIRLTGLEISELTDDMSQGVQSAGQVVKQVDQSISGVKQQVQKAQTTSRSVFAGAKAAWKTLTQTAPTRRTDRLSSPKHGSINLNESRRPDRKNELLDRPYATPGYLAYPEFDDSGDEILELDSHLPEGTRNGTRDALRETNDRSDKQPTQGNDNF